MVIVWLFLGLVVWIVIGAVILSAMDDERQSLLQWAKECPAGGALTVMLAWPVVVWWIWWNVKHDQKRPNKHNNTRDGERSEK